MFYSLHDLSHPGIQATQKLITARFIWPGINTDVCSWTCSCIKFQHAKIQRHSHTPLSSFPVPDAHFNVIHIDLVGPLPTAKRFHIPADLCRKLHQVARSFPTLAYHCRSGCSSFPQWLDFSLWCLFYYRH